MYGHMLLGVDWLNIQTSVESSGSGGEVAGLDRTLIGIDGTAIMLSVGSGGSSDSSGAPVHARSESRQ